VIDGLKRSDENDFGPRIGYGSNVDAKGMRWVSLNYLQSEARKGETKTRRGLGSRKKGAHSKVSKSLGVHCPPESALKLGVSTKKREPGGAQKGGRGNFAPAFRKEGETLIAGLKKLVGKGMEIPGSSLGGGQEKEVVRRKNPRGKGFTMLLHSAFGHEEKRVIRHKTTSSQI